jgi:hypothetical protein
VLIAKYQHGRRGRRVGLNILVWLRLWVRPHARIWILLTPLPLLVETLQICLVRAFLILVVGGVRIPPPGTPAPPPWPSPAAIKTEAVTKAETKAKIIAIVIKAVEPLPLEPSVVEERIVTETASSKVEVMDPWISETLVSETGTAEAETAKSGIMKARPSAHPTERSSTANAPAETTVSGEATVGATTLSEGRHYR